MKSIVLSVAIWFSAFALGQTASSWELKVERNGNLVSRMFWEDSQHQRVDALSHEYFVKLNEVLEADAQAGRKNQRIHYSADVPHAAVIMPSVLDGGIGLDGGLIVLVPGKTATVMQEDPRNTGYQLREPMVFSLHKLGFFFGLAEGNKMNIFFLNLYPNDPTNLDERLEKLADINLFRFTEGDVKIQMTEHEVIVQTGRNSQAFRPFGKKGEGQLIFSELTPRNMDTLEGTYAGYDVTAAAKRGELDIVNQDPAMLDQMIQTLTRQQNRSVILHGPAGTEAMSQGMVAALADKIVKGEIPELKGWKIVSISYSRFATDGLVDKGLGKVRDFLDVVRQKKVIILFEQIEQLIGLGVDASARGTSGDVASGFVTDLKAGSVVVIGLTSSGADGYLGMSAKHSSFSNQFRAFAMTEPTGQTLFAILKSAAKKREEEDKVVYSDDLLRFIIEMTDRHLPGEKQPTKSLQALKDLTEQFRPEHPERFDTPLVSVTEPSVNEWLAKKSGRHTLAEVDNTKGMRLFLSGDNFMKAMDEKVVGHPAAKEAIRRSLFSILAGRGKKDSKGGELGVQVLMFLGPSGVGKSYIPRALSDSLAQKPYEITWPWKAFEGSVYQDESAVNRLFGSSPGYIGYKPGSGSLYSFVKQNQQAVITLEEIDKMHNSVIQALYPFLEYGIAIDSNTQEEAYFTRGIVFMTSNYGSISDAELDMPAEQLALIQRDPKVCDLIDRWDRVHIFGKSDPEVEGWDEDRLKEELFKKIERAGAISSQVLGRVGPSNLIIMHHLSEDEILEIGRRSLAKLQASYWESHQAKIEFAPDVMSWLRDKAWGHDGGRTFRYGARSILSYVDSVIAPTLGEFEVIQGKAAQKRTWRMTHIPNTDKLKVELVP